jgi:hypothetical protein
MCNFGHATVENRGLLILSTSLAGCAEIPPFRAAGEFFSRRPAGVCHSERRGAVPSDSVTLSLRSLLPMRRSRPCDGTTGNDHENLERERR